MSTTTEDDQLGRKAWDLAMGSEFWYRHLGALSLHPATYQEAVANSEVHPVQEPPAEMGLAGYQILRSENVPEGEVRPVPAGVLEPISHKGQVYPWPAFTIETGRRDFQVGAHVTASGRLEPESEYLSPPFPTSAAPGVARALGGRGAG